MKVLNWNDLHHDAPFATLCGIVGGFGKYFLDIQNGPYVLKVTEAAFTALICGFAGVAGKEIFQYIKRKYKARKPKTQL